MTEIKNTFEAIEDHVNNLDDGEKVALHNQYCQENNYGDDEIYENDEEFFEVHFSNTMEAVRAVSFGDFNYSHTYIVFNGYANLETFNDPEVQIDISAIVNAIQEDPATYDIELTEEEEEE